MLTVGAMRLATVAVLAALCGTLPAGVTFAQGLMSADGRSVGSSGKGLTRQLTETEKASAKSRLPMLTSLSQVPGYDGVQPQGYGTAGHPFTTKGAYSSSASGSPVQLNPWRSTGKLYMQFGASTYVCTASVIDKGLLVTAAHCVHDYGQGVNGWADAVWFEPARHGTTLYYGTWTANTWWIPTVYFNGTDVCSTVGIVCENDLAIVVLNTGPAAYAGKHIAQVVGRYLYYANNQGYVNFLGKTATQLTQLGYPVAFDSGLKMIRTDSLGYQAAPNNVIIGSDQTGGSSGGPWLMNFGWDPVSTSSVPSFNARNRVVATTSWGYISSTIKTQGASRFANNTAFPAPGPSNIASLIASACGGSPANCY